MSGRRTQQKKQSSKKCLAAGGIDLTLVSENHPTVTSGNVTEATGTELTSVLAEIQRSAFQGNVGFTSPEEENDDEEESSEKEGDGESEVQDVGGEVAHSEETVEYGREERWRDKRRKSVEPRESNSLMLANMLGMMMQNQIEAKWIEQEREDKERRRKGNGEKRGR